jgi:hypothetical protein
VALEGARNDQMLLMLIMASCFRVGCSHQAHRRYPFHDAGDVNGPGGQAQRVGGLLVDLKGGSGAHYKRERSSGARERQDFALLLLLLKLLRFPALQARLGVVELRAAGSTGPSLRRQWRPSVAGRPGCNEWPGTGQLLRHLTPSGGAFCNDGGQLTPNTQIGKLKWRRPRETAIVREFKSSGQADSKAHH